MILTKATLQDLNELSTLEQTLFETVNFPLSKSSFRYHIKNNLLYTSKIDNKIVGYILILIKRKKAKIYSIGVMQEFRGKQISKKLLEIALDTLKTLQFEKTILEVRSDNNLAIALYKQFDFKTIKEVPSFYLDGCSAYIMEKNYGL